ncbi:MAG: Hsp70 family protein, partial [Flavobacterium sp.]
MGNEQFESLAQALMQRLLGANSIVFGKGPDGGRELSYQGKTNFPNDKTAWEGYWIVQAKYKSRDDTATDSFNWVKYNIEREIKKFQEKERALPDNYIFITNAVLSAVEQKGGRDKIQKYINDQKSLIPHILVISYDELCKLIDNNLDVRSAYTHLLTTGDILHKSLESLKRNELNTVLHANEIREVTNNTKRNYAFLSGEISETLVAIDFGSSYSLVAYINDNGETTFVKSDKNQILLPTCITFFKNGTYVVGKPEYRKIEQTITIANFKRELGKNKEYDVFGKKISAEELSRYFIESLKQNITDYLGAIPRDIVISKPTYFTIRQTNLLVNLFCNADFKVRRFIAESSASSLNYADHLLKKTDINDTSCLAIDLGGGTFDLSVFSFGDDVYQVNQSYGSSYLGGFDYDIALLNHCLSVLEKQQVVITENIKWLLLYECERAKIVLNDAENTVIVLHDLQSDDGNLRDIKIPISKKEFIDITAKLNEKIFKMLCTISREYKIETILICGQAAKLFSIQEIIKHLFPDVMVIDAYAENAVIKGLIKTTGVLNGKVRNTLLLDTSKEVIAIKCVAPSTKKIVAVDRLHSKFDWEISNGILSVEEKANIQFSNLIEPDTIIPTKGNSIFNLRNPDNKKHLCLVFYEYERTSGKYEFLGKY